MARSKISTLTRTTATSTKAVAQRAADLIVDYLPEVIDRVIEVQRQSSLQVNITIKPAGRTEATKDPQVSISAKPQWGEEVVTFKARLSGEGDDAQLSLIGEMLAADEADEEEAELAGDEAATG